MCPADLIPKILKRAALTGAISQRTMQGIEPLLNAMDGTKKDKV